MAKTKLEAGDLFSIPLEDGTFGLGMFHKYTPDALGSCICSFYSNRFDDPNDIKKLFKEQLIPISLVFVTKDLLHNRTWKKIHKLKPIFEDSGLPDVPYEKAGSYKGSKIYGSGIVREFLNSYFGILPWDMMLDPNYFDKLLLAGIQRPENILFSKA